MFSKVSQNTSGVAASIIPTQHPAPSQPSVKETPPAQQQAAVPFLLTRIYEGKRPFLAADQDSLSKIFKPLVRIENHQPTELRLNELQKIGEAPNSNGLGVFLNQATGEKYYIKKSTDAGKARNEVLCATLASHFGVNVPKVKTFEDDGKHYIASPFIEGLTLANEMFPNCAIDPCELVKVARACPEVWQAYVVAAWLNNRDILGLGLDNFGFTRDTDGTLTAHFLDFGGSGVYRATSGRKVFDGVAKEFSTMTEPQLQADQYGGGPNGLVFGGIPVPVLQASLERIFALPDIELKSIIDQHIPDAEQNRKFFDLMIQRRNSIQEQLTSGTHDRFCQKRQEAIDYGINSAYEWDSEDPEINAHIQKALGQEISAYCDENRHLMADGGGQLAIAAGVQSLVSDLLNRLLIEKNGARLNWAAQKKQIEATAEAEAAAQAHDGS